jgi:DNA-binding XRE family transcriptional regulator
MTTGTKTTTGNTLNHRMRDLRGRKLWSQEELARRAKVSTWTIQRAETGKLVPHVMTQEKIARALGVPRDVLFPEDGQD